MKHAWRKSSQVGKQFELTLLSTKPQHTFATPILRARGAAYSQMLPKAESGKESSDPTIFRPKLSALFVGKFSSSDDLLYKAYLQQLVSVLKNELLESRNDPEKIERVCKEKGAPLFRRYSDGSAVVELFNQFSSSPELALQEH